MATRELVATELGSITGGPPAASGSPPCGAGIIGGMSILRFGKSLPLVELFETFMIAGFVLVSVAAANYFTFHHISEILKTEGASPAAISLSNAAASSNPVWVAIGVVLFVIGVMLYYLHRRVLSNPS